MVITQCLAYLVALRPLVEGIDDKSLELLCDVSVDLTLGGGFALETAECHEK